MVKKVINKLFDIIIILTSLLVIFVMIWIMFSSIQVWLDIFNHAIDIKSKGFWAGILLAICSGTMYFVEIWVNTFGKTFRNLFPEKKKLK